MPFLKNRRVIIPNSVRLENSATKSGLHKSIFSPSGKCSFRGTWRSDKKEGFGVLKFENGVLYEGYFEKNLPKGFGILSCKNVLRYRGNWHDGKRSGFGEGHFENGSYYKGYWKNGNRDGYGQMWYCDGSFYDGDWKCDLRHGMGMFVRCDGNRYEGNWEFDVKSGRGQFFHLDSGQMQEGVWKMDECLCSCIVDLPFRNTAIEPTAYPIKTNDLTDCNHVYDKQLEKILKTGQVASCLND